MGQLNLVLAIRAMQGVKVVENQLDVVTHRSDGSNSLLAAMLSAGAR